MSAYANICHPYLPASGPRAAPPPPSSSSAFSSCFPSCYITNMLVVLLDTSLSTTSSSPSPSCSCSSKEFMLLQQLARLRNC